MFEFSLAVKHLAYLTYYLIYSHTNPEIDPILLCLAQSKL